jgi:hypothetical protein
MRPVHAPEQRQPVLRPAPQLVRARVPGPDHVPADMSRAVETDQAIGLLSRLVSDTRRPAGPQPLRLRRRQPRHQQRPHWPVPQGHARRPADLLDPPTALSPTTPATPRSHLYGPPSLLPLVNSAAPSSGQPMPRRRTPAPPTFSSATPTRLTPTSSPPRRPAAQTATTASAESSPAAETPRQADRPAATAQTPPTPSSNSPEPSPEPANKPPRTSSTWRLRSRRVGAPLRGMWG